ncbi:MAG: PAS domain-containing protein [Bacteroidetes bacterium]|jgi:PAS domain S-box-containing protein|nr:PAS domain-containing protein [Bacteroidota bacterium]
MSIKEECRILDFVKDFLFIIQLNDNNKPGRILYANDFACDNLGYSYDEIIEKSISDFLDPEPKEEIKNIFSANFIESKFNTVLISNESIWMDVEAETHFIEHEGENAGLLVARDITEHKKLDEEFSFLNEELINQKENFQALIDNLTQTQEQLVQSEKMAALGQLIAGIAHEINTPLGAIKASIGNMNDSLDNIITDLPHLILEISNEEKELFVRLLKMADPEESATLSSRDKRKLRREISQKLSDNNIESPESLADVCIYLNLYNNFDSLLPLFNNQETHTILAAVKNLVSLDKNKSTISIAVEKASKVVFALKKFAHHDPSGEMVETDIVDSIETVLTLYHNQIKQGINVIREFEEIPMVNCYADEINQVWTNLIHNSLQAMGQSGTLTVSVESDEGNVVVKIGDTGTGIEPEISEKIFEPFFTTKKSGEGSGLGLDIVKKIVEKHDGSISFESAVNVGTTFKIELPVHG